MNCDQADTELIRMGGYHNPGRRVHAISMHGVLFQPWMFSRCYASCFFGTRRAIQIEDSVMIGAGITSMQCTATEACIEA